MNRVSVDCLRSFVCMNSPVYGGLENIYKYNTTLVGVCLLPKTGERDSAEIYRQFTSFAHALVFSETFLYDGRCE